jgi:hypothetical protein
MTTFNNVTLNEKGLVCHTQRGADRFDTPFAQVSKLICYILQIKFASQMPPFGGEKRNWKTDSEPPFAAFADVSYGSPSAVDLCARRRPLLPRNRSPKNAGKIDGAHAGSLEIVLWLTL